ncbi:MAG: 3'(2'),5'-bisphosphate nucleotidase CysQ [Leptospira sp.]|nr:3'(2'),5'-bisphosphate nucleotidase CysQ [Leptospira sp.]
MLNRKVPWPLEIQKQIIHPIAKLQRKQKSLKTKNRISNDLKDELLAAIRIILPAGKEVQEIYNSDFKVSMKGRNDPLTEADLKANTMIISYLEKEFPDDEILSEETHDNLKRLKKKRVWIIDPIDGTREFVAKNPEYAISIGLSIGHVSLLGVIFNPATGELFAGISGQGICYLKIGPDFQINSEEIVLSKLIDQVVPGTENQLIISRSEFESGLFDKNPFWKKNFRLRPIGSIAYKLGLVASGQAPLTVSLKPKNEWDICAGVALIDASGGISVDVPDFSEFVFNLKSTRREGVISGNRESVRNLIEKFPDILHDSYHA